MAGEDEVDHFVGSFSLSSEFLVRVVFGGMRRGGVGGGGPGEDEGFEVGLLLQGEEDAGDGEREGGVEKGGGDPGEGGFLERGPGEGGDVGGGDEGALGRS